MTKGQRAMSVAKIYPEPEKGERRKKALKYCEFGISRQYIGFARTVLAYAADLKAGVLSGSVFLDAAYATARERMHIPTGTGNAVN
ncbi:MAG: hypothetical protein O7C66_04300 [Alphaproteobacteria bacterium]|nr:hypothetical protein [Alphaproteobacteria bacterium]